MKTILLIVLFLSLKACADVDLVRVDKPERKMYLLDGADVIREYDISLGANPMGQRNWWSWFAPIIQNFDWTNGCIALSNSEMEEFMN